MANLRGMLVRLRTSGLQDSGTDDAIYIGVFGSDGGREFPLDVKNFNDFESGLVKYVLGTVWDGSVLPGAKNPANSQPFGANDPAVFPIELGEVEFVYVRKQARQGNTPAQDPDIDNAYRFSEVGVTLYSQAPESRTFSAAGGLQLGHEFGLQAWLSEEGRRHAPSWNLIKA